MITYANDVTWLEASLSLGWEPADDDDAEDADAGDDADVRFRLFFCRPRKANTAACPAAQLDVAATTDCFEAYVIQHAIRDGWQPGGCASWSLRWRLINIHEVQASHGRRMLGWAVGHE